MKDENCFLFIFNFSNFYIYDSFTVTSSQAFEYSTSLTCRSDTITVVSNDGASFALWPRARTCRSNAGSSKRGGCICFAKAPRPWPRHVHQDVWLTRRSSTRCAHSLSELGWFAAWWGRIRASGKCTRTSFAFGYWPGCQHSG